MLWAVSTVHSQKLVYISLKKLNKLVYSNDMVSYIACYIVEFYINFDWSASLSNFVLIKSEPWEGNDQFMEQRGLSFSNSQEPLQYYNKNTVKFFTPLWERDWEDIWSGTFNRPFTTTSLSTSHRHD